MLSRTANIGENVNSLTQIPLGFGNSIVSETMLSMAFSPTALLIYWTNMQLHCWLIYPVRTSLIISPQLNNHSIESQIAMGTGFSRLFRGLGGQQLSCISWRRYLDETRLLGQVGGVAFSSAIFQWNLDVELHARINGPDAEEVCIESWRKLGIQWLWIYLILAYSTN